MASIYPRGNRWRAEVERGNHPRISRSFPRKADAEQWAIETEAQYLGTSIAVDRKQTVRRTMERYAAEVSPKRRGARWEQVRITKMLREWSMANSALSDISPDDIGRLRDKMLRGGLSAGSVRRELGLLSAVFEVARTEWRWTRHNPVKDVRLPAKPASRKRLIADDEVRAMVEALGFTGARPETLSQQIAVAFLLALETGMRAGEITSLEWRQVFSAARYLRLERTKNGDSRDVPLSTRAVDLLKLMQGVDDRCVFTVTGATRDVLFRKARQRAGLEGFTFHDARHTAVTRLADRLDVLELARMIGHRDLKSLMIYYNKPASAMALKLG